MKSTVRSSFIEGGEICKVVVKYGGTYGENKIFALDNTLNCQFFVVGGIEDLLTYPDTMANKASVFSKLYNEAGVPMLMVDLGLHHIKDFIELLNKCRLNIREQFDFRSTNDSKRSLILIQQD